jgi:hypothetical protein
MFESEATYKAVGKRRARIEVWENAEFPISPIKINADRDDKNFMFTPNPRHG